MQYTPLSLYNATGDPTSTKFELREHKGGVPEDKNVQVVEEKLAKNSLINFGKDFPAKLCICICLYNEPLSQLIESLAGIFRAYYELGKINSHCM